MGGETEAKGGATNDGRKRKRRYLPHNKPVKKKGPSPLRPGVVGFFITCDGGREHQASQEALNVIESFFEELIHGKDPSTGVSAIPAKPLNKKITFTYSDSSDSEEDDDENDNGAEEEDVSERPAEGDKDEESKESTDDKTSNDEKKDEQPQEVLSEQTDNKEADNNKPQVDVESEENKEPPAKKQCSDAKKPGNGNHVLVGKSEKSVDELIEDELKELKDKGKRRFAKLDTGCNGVVFILMRKRVGDPGPRQIVQHMMEVAASTKKHMSRFLLRVLPVEASSYASPEEISRAMKPIVDQYFPVDAEVPVKFAVQYDARANSGIERMKIIDAVAKSVPVPHKVDLKNPEKTIIVQIIKTVCLIGVVEKYKELAKYNIRQLTS